MATIRQKLSTYAIAILTHIGFFILIGGITVIYGSIRLCWRCGYYALTGKNNINRDSF